MYLDVPYSLRPCARSDPPQPAASLQLLQLLQPLPSSYSCEAGQATLPTPGHPSHSLHPSLTLALAVSLALSLATPSTATLPASDTHLLSRLVPSWETPQRKAGCQTGKRFANLANGYLTLQPRYLTYSTDSSCSCCRGPLPRLDHIIPHAATALLTK